MIYIITIILTVLVGINFLLLKFSCNEITKRVSDIEKPKVINTKHSSINRSSRQLAPTGS